MNQANRHVALGEEHLSHQRERIAQLEEHDHDTSRAEELLALFGEMQGMHLAHRDRLARQLGILA